MAMTTLQASLLGKPRLAFTCPSPTKQRLHHHSRSLSFIFCSLPCYIHAVSPEFHNLRFRLRGTLTFCKFRPANVSSWSESNSLGDDISSVDEESDINRTAGESLGIAEGISAFVSEGPRVDVIDADSWKTEARSGIEELSLETNEMGLEEKGEKVGKIEGKSATMGRKDGDAKLPILAFSIGLLARTREGFQKGFL